MLRPGDRFDRYLIQEVIGSGGMGCVYRALDRRLRREVALKLLVRRHGDAASGDPAARLLREAQAAAALDHPNAVRVFDVGTVGDQPFIAMELVAGRTLTGYAGPSSVDDRRKVRWLTDIASALAAAHRANLVHRDVKPENVMVREDGSVKVLDFGVVRVGWVGPEEELASRPFTDESTRNQLWAKLTADGRLMGTPLYMAPEQILHAPLDGRCDQFAWGVVAYELFVGRTPWPERAPIAELLQAIVTQPVDTLPEEAAAVPPTVARVILRALRKRPEERFASMEDLVAELEPYAAPILLSTRPAAAPAAESPSALARTEAVAVPPVRRRWPLALAAFAMLAGGATALVLLRGRASPGPGERARAGAAMAAVRLEPTPITDLPRPVSGSPDALAAYVAGLQALRDGDSTRANASLEQAVALDPGMAAAELRLAYTSISASQPAARAHFARARELRGLLTERDAALLDALEPLVWRQPPDAVETKRRLAAALQVHPLDAELALLQAMQIVDDFAGAARALDAVVQIDPRFARAWWMKAQRLAYLGELEQALEALDRCVEISRSAAVCLHDRMWIDQELGRCDRVEADARTLISIDGSSEAFVFLANALHGQGKPIEGVREALRQREALAPGPGRAILELHDRAQVALATGDFAGGERAARELERRATALGVADSRTRAARMLVELLVETGHTADAGRVADHFQRQRAAWDHDPGVEDFAMARDPTPTMLRAELGAGLLTDAAFDAQQGAWIADWEKRAAPAARVYLWAYEIAAGVESAPAARRALDALPRFQPQPRFWPLALPEEPMGRALFLAGRAAEALPHLEIATRSCLALDHPIAHTRAHWFLGQTKEALGDRAGACQAYEVVRARWGAARPPSVTAKQALERARALGCR